MIEALFAMLVALVEAIVGLVTALIEAIAGLFSAGGQALSAVEALLTLASILLELTAWAVLFLVELLVALLTWRKPRKVARPVFWRSRKGRGIAPEKAANGEPREGRHDA